MPVRTAARLPSTSLSGFDDPATRQSSRRLFWFAVATLLVLSAIFLVHYSKSFATHYPVYADQPDYIWHVYHTYFAGFIESDSVANTLGEVLKLANLKGWVLEALGLLAVLLFGPSRTALVLANVALFWCLALAFTLYFGRQFRPRVGLFALGLLLLSSSITEIAGGMEDLRWDFAGIVTFGLAFLALVRLLIRSDWRSLLLYAGAVFLSISTRSITGVYLGVTAAFAFLLLLGIAAVARDPFWWARVKFLFLAGVATGAAFLLQFLLFLPSIIGYYGRQIFSDERAIRLDMAGITGQLGLFKYYWAQLGVHFSLLLSVGAAAILLAILSASIGLAMNRGSAGTTPARTDLLRMLAIALVAGLSMLVGVLVPLSLWSPSPIVAGVLTGPLAGFGALLFGIADRVGWTPAPRQPGARGVLPAPNQILAGLVLCAGCVAFVFGTWGSGITGPYLKAVQTVDDYQEQLVKDLQPTGGMIAWVAIADWAGLSVLDIYLWEHGLSDLVPRYDGGPLDIFAAPPELVLKRLEPADAVLIYRAFNPPSLATYPLLVSLEQSRGIWQPVLDREFILRSEIPLPYSQEVVGYYLRPVRLKGVTGAQATFSRSHADFSMGAAPVGLHVSNMATDAREFRLTFTARPGPQAADQTRSAVTLALGGTVVEVATDAAKAWQASVRLTVPPGDSIITLTSRATPAAAVPAAQATLLTHIGELAATTHLGP